MLPSTSVAAPLRLHLRLGRLDEALQVLGHRLRVLLAQAHVRVCDLQCRRAAMSSRSNAS